MSIHRITVLAVILAMSVALVPSRAVAEARAADGFAAWLAGLADEAQRRGLATATISRALGNARYLPRVIELDRRQPEFTLTFWRYLNGAVSEKRVERGRRMLRKHRALLDKVAKRYGVQPRFLLAFWGLESNYGDFTGSFPLISALATLAYDQRRAKFFREQLFAALEIMGRGDIPVDVKSSWAGAMGNAQFIPTTYRAYAVDFDGDGRRDMWRSLPDVFASAANFLGKSGWRADRTWGREVRLPKTFDFALSGLSVRKTLPAWQALGVRRVDGRDLPKADIEASLVLPSGAGGPAFLVYENFRATLVWNRSIFYAIAVGHLADRIAGGGRLLTPPPRAEVPLSRADMKEIQRLLTARGFDTGGADGVAGPMTRRAIKAYQRRINLPADGYPDADLLHRLKKGG